MALGLKRALKPIKRLILVKVILKADNLPLAEREPLLRMLMVHLEYSRLLALNTLTFL